MGAGRRDGAWWEHPWGGREGDPVAGQAWLGPRTRSLEGLGSRAGGPGGPYASRRPDPAMRGHLRRWDRRGRDGMVRGRRRRRGRDGRQRGPGGDEPALGSLRARGRVRPHPRLRVAGPGPRRGGAAEPDGSRGAPEGRAGSGLLTPAPGPRGLAPGPEGLPGSAAPEAPRRAGLGAVHPRPGAQRRLLRREPARPQARGVRGGRQREGGARGPRHRAPARALARAGRPPLAGRDPHGPAPAAHPPTCPSTCS